MALTLKPAAAAADDDIADDDAVVDKWQHARSAAEVLWLTGVLCTEERRVSRLELQPHHGGQCCLLSLYRVFSCSAVNDVD